MNQTGVALRDVPAETVGCRMSARGSTRPGVRAALPEGNYEVRSAVDRLPGCSVCVDFEGEDSRSRTFDFADCELPG